MSIVSRLFSRTAPLERILQRIIAAEDPDERYELEKEVGALGRDAVPPLAAYLESGEPEWREAAAVGIAGMARSGPMLLELVIKTALEPLIQGLSHDSPAVRSAMTTALGTVITRFENDRMVMDGLNPRLAGMVAPAVDPLVAMLKDESLEVRLEAAGQLKIGTVDSIAGSGDRYRDRAEALLVRALDHESEQVRRKAAVGLLFHPDDEIREKAEAIHFGDREG